ncbi:CoA transferase [Gammaproteobacteria bacterium LSUCC0057]|uniref:CoA transferase n=1 Tax=Gammaproteobacteria bacterium LSUCC0057 TaxID=2559237 RepID=A0A4Y8UIZ4_9GAMM|nr:CoA transferase [Gammaproteobacteria bacterium LSUCC0057]
MGALSGMRVIELEGLGPAPFAGMLLADMGADVITVGRKIKSSARPAAISERGKQTVALDLKSAEGLEALLKLCEGADILIEGFRPGVAERLGFGPEQLHSRNPQLIYGRITGWGQTGPLAQAAGHDLNYIALTGALHAIGRAGETPVPPLNLVGDFGGGALFLVMGVLAAVIERHHSGQGQVIDAAMTEGVANLMHMMQSMHAAGMWQDRAGCNVLDGAAHFYDSYRTSDDKFITIGSIEPQFYALLIEKLDLDPTQFAAQMDPRQWPALKAAIAAKIATQSRQYWCELMEGSDVCFAPVLSMSEAPQHPHNRARNSFIEVDGVTQAAPAPRFSRTPSDRPSAAKPLGSDTAAVLSGLGYDDETVAAMLAAVSR